MKRFIIGFLLFLAILPTPATGQTLDGLYRGFCSRCQPQEFFIFAAQATDPSGQTVIVLVAFAPHTGWDILILTGTTAGTITVASGPLFNADGIEVDRGRVIVTGTVATYRTNRGIVATLIRLFP